MSCRKAKVAVRLAIEAKIASTALSVNMASVVADVAARLAPFEIMLDRSHPAHHQPITAGVLTDFQLSGWQLIRQISLIAW